MYIRLWIYLFLLLWKSTCKWHRQVKSIIFIYSRFFSNKRCVVPKNSRRNCTSPYGTADMFVNMKSSKIRKELYRNWLSPTKHRAQDLCEIYHLKLYSTVIYHHIYNTDFYNLYNKTFYSNCNVIGTTKWNTIL